MTCNDMDKERKIQKSFLRTIHPIIGISKFLGVSPFWIHNKDGCLQINVSSSFTILYSYIFLVGSVILQTLAVKGFSRVAGLAFRNWYLSVRILPTSLLNYRLLLKRFNICEVLQMTSTLNIELSRYYIVLPATILSTMFFLSVFEPVTMGFGFKECLLIAIMDMRPPLVAIYACFIYGCQAVILKIAVQKLNMDLQKSIRTPKESSTLRPAITRFFSLNRMCREVNEVFGQQVFLTSSAACLDITYCLFASCKAGENNVIAVDVLWALLNLVPEVTVMIVCQQVENAMDESKALSMEILMETELPRERKKEAQELNLQLRQLPLRFSARGLFYLNGQQLSAAISTYITYTIILVQNTA